MSRNKFLAFIIGFIVLLWMACQFPNTNRTEESSADLLKKEYQLFAEKLEQAINQSDPSYFNANFDLGTLLQRTLGLTDAPADFEDGFRAGVTDNLDVGEQMVSSLGLSGHYKLLHLKMEDDRAKAFYRMISEDGINYHEISMAIGEMGQFFIEDFYILMGGNPFSKTLERIYMTTINQEIPEDTFLLNQMPDVERLYALNQTKIEKIESDISRTRYRSALYKFNKLPKELQTDKMMQIMKLNISFYLGQSQYQKAINEFRSLYPKDVVLDLMMLDFAFLKQNLSSAIAVMDSIDKKVGGDPYLKVMKADIYRNQKDNDAAEALLWQAIEEEQDQEEAYWSLIDLLLTQNKVEEAIGLFKPMQDAFNINPAEFLLSDGFDNLWEHKVYKEWESKNPIPDSLFKMKKGFNIHEIH